MGISRKENGSLVKKAGRTLVDLALSLTSHNAIANSAVTQEINQINTSLSDKGIARQFVVEISASSGIEIGRWIKNNISTDILQKGLTFNFIPTLSPSWWSGQMFSDSGDTWWGYYINRDTNKIYKYVASKAGDSIVIIGGNMRPNFSNLLASLTTDGTVTATTDSFLVGTINQYGELFINDVNIGRTGDKPVNFYLPLKAGDIVRISNYAQQTSEARIRIYGVLN